MENNLMMMPAGSIDSVIERRNLMVEFVRKAMTKDVDYGVIPGTQKNTLLKPGAEKLNTLFGLTPRFVEVKSVEDWTGENHRAPGADQFEPFFYYWQKCQLLRDGVIVGEGDGSCNSWEKKYRYRSSERVCPNCGKPAIIKGKEEYGGGWLCFEKKGGCKSKFKIDDAAIVDQVIGQVPNLEIADQVNTLLKMAQKRALIAATLLAVNASEFFTQDIEDMYIEATYRDVTEPTDGIRKDKSATNEAAAQRAELERHAEAVGQQMAEERIAAERANNIPPLPEKVHVPSHENGKTNGNGETPKHKAATIKTTRFPELVKNAISYGYIDDDPKTAPYRLTNVAGAAGFKEITDANLHLVWTAISTHYEAKRSDQDQTEPTAAELTETTH